MSHLPWFMELTFQVPMQYCSLQYQTLPTRCNHSLASILLLPSPFIFSETISPLFPCSILDAYCPGGIIFPRDISAFSYCPWCSQGKNTGVVCHSLLQWTTFHQNSSPWPVYPEWSCTAWFIASLSYVGPFATTRLGSM